MQPREHGGRRAAEGFQQLLGGVFGSGFTLGMCPLILTVLSGDSHIEGGARIPKLRTVTRSRRRGNIPSLRVFLGRIRGTLKREHLPNPLLALLNRDLIQRVFIPKGPPNPIP